MNAEHLESVRAARLQLLDHGDEAAAKALEALKKIEDPITYFRSQLGPGEQLNGVMAVQLSNDPAWLKNVAREAIAALESAAPSAAEPVAIQDGWKLVPIEPTRDMLEVCKISFINSHGRAPWERNRRAFRAMVAAAPPAPQAAAPEISTAHGPWLPSRYDEGETYCERCLTRSVFADKRKCEPHIVSAPQAASEPASVAGLSGDAEREVWEEEAQRQKLMDLIEQYGDESRTAAYHGELHCRKKPAELLEEIRAALHSTGKPQAIPSSAVGAEPGRRNPLLAYVDSYREMARMGDGRVSCLAVALDIEQNMAPLLEPPVQSTQCAATADAPVAEPVTKYPLPEATLRVMFAATNPMKPLGMDVLVDGKSVAVLTFDAARAALSQGGGA